MESRPAVTLAELLERRPDLTPFAEPMRAVRELHGQAWEQAFNPRNDAWAVDLSEASDPRKAA
jgi:hypothetical protein